MSEKRTNGRSFKRLKVKYGICEPKHLGISEDISSGGLFIKTIRPLPPREKVEVIIYTKDDKTVSLEGCVRWIKRIPSGLIRLKKKGGMAIRITKFISGEEMYKELCAGKSHVPDN